MAKSLHPTIFLQIRPLYIKQSLKWLSLLNLCLKTMTYFCVFQLACVCSCRRSLLLSPWELNCWFSLGPPEAQKIRYGKQRGDNTVQNESQTAHICSDSITHSGFPSALGLTAYYPNNIRTKRHPDEINWEIKTTCWFDNTLRSEQQPRYSEHGNRVLPTPQMGWEESSLDTTGVISCVEPSSDVHSSKNRSKLNHLWGVWWHFLFCFLIFLCSSFFHSLGFHLFVFALLSKVQERMIFLFTFSLGFLFTKVVKVEFKSLKVLKEFSCTHQGCIFIWWKIVILWNILLF